MVIERELETLFIVQARVSSKRLPSKVLKLINSRPILEWQILRVMQTSGPNQVVLATSEEIEDDQIESLASNCGIPTVRGSLNNVYSRFVKTVDIYRPKVVVRITGDCPLFMPKLCESMLKEFENRNVDYLSNVLDPTYPDGCDIEIFSSNALKQLGTFDLTASELEHVTLGIYNRKNIFKCENFFNSQDDSAYRWTLDTADDLNFIANVYNKFAGFELSFTYEDVMLYLQQNPSLIRYANRKISDKGSLNV